jgi:hypothetical protein
VNHAIEVTLLLPFFGFYASTPSVARKKFTLRDQNGLVKVFTKFRRENGACCEQESKLLSLKL